MCVVSSGAIALGLPRLGLTRRPPRGAAPGGVGAGPGAAARAWEEALGAHGLPAAQILLAAGDIADRAAYVNVRNAFAELFGLGAVPVVNENDATATDEITFGDNDALAAQVAMLVARAAARAADRGRGRLHAGARDAGRGADRRRAQLAGEAELGRGAALGRGGMGSKVLAAQMASAAGIPTVIAGGAGDDVLGPILAGEPRGTRFTAGGAGASAFKLWLRFAEAGAGRLHVDDGARRALVGKGRACSPSGSSAARVASSPGAAVELVGPDGTAFAKGIAAADSERAHEPPARRRGRAPRQNGAVHVKKLAVIADVHGNEPALAAVLDGDRARARRT